jgi:DNA adenine methylase
MRPLLNYYGGKYSLAPWLISKFPEHKIFVDLFCGSASVLLRKERAKVDVVNDIDSRIIKLFRILQERPDDLRALLFVTPYSREIYKSAKIEGNDLEVARDLIVRSFMGIGNSIKNGSSGFRNSRTPLMDPAKSWRAWWDHLGETIDRFRGVIIENLDWQDCIDKYDSKDTLFYIDPPYSPGSRASKNAYDYEFRNHAKLVEKIKTIKGKFAYSCYEQEGLNDFRIFRKKARTQGESRVETLYVKED